MEFILGFYLCFYLYINFLFMGQKVHPVGFRVGVTSVIYE